MSHEYHEDISLADIAFSAEATSLEALLVEGAKATFEAMADLKKIKPKVKKEFRIEADSPEKLFFEWIEHLIFLKDAEYMVFSRFEAKVSEGEKWKLEGRAWGEKIDPKRHELKVDVKAITYHQFKVEKFRSGWRAFVILDI